MSRKTLLWLVPVLVTIHDLEEALFMPAFLEKRNASIPDSLRGIIPTVTYRQFLIALVIITIIPYVIALFLNGRWAVYLLVCFQVVILINVFAHVVTSIFQKGYGPGLATALLINLPFSLYLLRRVVLERWMSKKALALMFPIGLLIHGPGLMGLMLLSGEIARTV